ncbi:MAG TPA: hypothetical protein VFR18_13960 [Terriglobia bacterium]|nr:hypothetical protein [Terriglobia bacterium]
MATDRNAAIACFRLGLAALLVLSFTSSLCPAGTASAAIDVSNQRDAQALRFIQDKLVLWQKRMNLTDWTITPNLVRKSTLAPKTLGGIRWDRGTSTATIDVLSTQDYSVPEQVMLDDMEFTIVHELVHLHLSSLPRSEASRTAEERVVNEIAEALIKLAKR